GVPLLTVALSLRQAVAVLVMPLVISNLAQSFEGGLFLPMVRRFWPVYLALLVSIVFSTRMLLLFPERYLFGVIGAALLIFPTLVHLRPKLSVSPAQERWLGPMTGLLSGFVGGISSYYGPVLLLYVMWLRLPKNVFVVAISQMFTVGAVGLGLGLFIFGVSSPLQFGASALACLPVLAGLFLGQRVRLRLTERRFALIVLVTYLITGTTFLSRLF